MSSVPINYSTQAIKLYVEVHVDVEHALKSLADDGFGAPDLETLVCNEIRSTLQDRPYVVDVYVVDA